MHTPASVHARDRLAPPLPDPAVVPAELTARAQWVCWRYAERDGKRTKEPIDPATGGLARTNDPATWGAFGQALAAARRAGLGVGFVLTADDPYTFIDLDAACDDQGALTPTAREIVELLDSYTEWSPSGRGVHIVVRGTLPPWARRKRGGIEAYDRLRYMTVTGNVLDGRTTIADRQAELERFAQRWLADPAPVAPQPVHADDDDDDEALLERARRAANGDKFQLLFDQGDWQGAGYSSQSEADLALVTMLSFWTGPDPARIDRLFRRSALYRAKWDARHAGDGRTYGQMTIARALAQRTEYWTARPVDDDQPGTPLAWPTLDPAAYHGLAGAFVRALAPYTEADGVGMLLTFLAAVGNALGPGPHVPVGTERHAFRVWPLLVGHTSKGRKGSSLAPVLEVMRLADPVWAAQCIVHGLVSGEGLIWAVRDPITTRERVKEGGQIQYIEVESDPGAPDKRLFVVEEEFARVLKAAGRQDNTLGPVLRQAWERDQLRTLAKNSPARATGAHVTVVGHVVAEEAQRYLTESEIAGGLANRFLWALVRRARLLPDPPVPDPRLIAELAEATRHVLERGRAIGALGRDAEATEAWREIYPTLSEGKPGLFGAIVARMEAQAIRLAGLYAVLDGSPLIRLPHLEAALAIVDYCETSARWIFGDATGDPIADQILAALAGGRMTRTELVHGLFGRNVPKGRIDAALRLLQSQGRIRVVTEPGDGRGRPTTWIEGIFVVRDQRPFSASGS
jgi:hypothetical protein